MGTDRSIEYQGPCLCGCGTFRIDDCEVDHAWPTATPQWYECHIDCPTCSEQFAFQQKGNRFVLIEQSVLKERQCRDQVAKDKAAAILSDEEVRSVIKKFEVLLGAQSSVAAIYRVFSGAGLENCAEGTFRRHWQSPRDWTKSWAKPKSLPQIFGVVGTSTERLSDMLSELSALEKHASQPPEQYGEPVYVLGR